MKVTWPPAFLFLFVVLIVCSAVEAGQAPEGFPKDPLRDLLAKQWALDEGLPTTSLTGVLQTREGFLWGTSFEGLFRFDGLRFEVFDKRRIAVHSAAASEVVGSEAELLADGFFDLVEGRAGELWVAAQGGRLVRYQDGLFRVFNTPVEGPVYSLCIDPDERLWIGGRSPAVFDLRQEESVPTTLPELRDVVIETIACQGETVWLGTDAGELFELHRDGSMVRSVKLAAHAIKAMAEGHDGSLWFGHGGGLERWYGGEKTRFSEFAGVQIHHLVEDGHGDLWLATDRGLGRRRRGGEVEWVEMEDVGLSEASALAFDREGSLWVAGKRGGLFRFTARKLASFTTRDGLRPGAVNAVYETAEGEILIGFGDGMVRVDGELLSAPRPMLPGRGFGALTFSEDESHLWAGSYQGLVQIDRTGVNFGVFAREKGFPSSEIRALHHDSQGGLWIGTGNRGVLEWKPGGTMEIYDQASGLVSDFVFSIAETPGGDLLFAMRGGFHHLSPAGELATWRTGEEIPGSGVFSILPDDEGRLWLATDGGLVRVDGETAGVLDKNQGLPTEVFFDVKEDGQGFFWISSSKGMLRVAKEMLNRTLDGQASDLEFQLFDEADGMSDRQCTGARRILSARDGRLWIPTHDGVTIVDPGNLELNEHPPPVVIDRFLVDGEEISQEEPQAPLAPGLHRITFEFAALSLRNPARNRVRYMLKGFDEEWQEADMERSISYTSLPAGSYVFRVQGANDDGLWNPSDSHIAFEVEPFYYESLSFRLGVTFFFLGAVMGIYLWRHRTLRRRNQELEELSEQRQRLIAALEERTQEIDRYLYIFSHDFKNPLLTIRNFTQVIRNDLDQGALGQARTDLHRITIAADQMNRQLDDLLKVAAVTRVSVAREPFDFVQIVRQVIEKYDDEIMRRGIEVVFSKYGIDAEGLEVVGERRRLTEVVHELLKNALKFLGDPPHPKIHVGLRREGGEMVCWIEDNGMGIAPSYHERVFRPLEQLDPGQEGTGIGLALVARVVEQHGGEVWLESEGAEHGTSVFFRMPLGDSKVEKGSGRSN